MGVTALTRRYVAWSRNYECFGTTKFIVTVSRIAPGAKRATYPATPECGPQTGCSANTPGSGAVGPAQRLALTDHGSLAWIAVDNYSMPNVAGPQFHEISKIVTGQPVLLIRATGIDPMSLRWSKTKLTWNQDGTPRFG